MNHEGDCKKSPEDSCEICDNEDLCKHCLGEGYTWAGEADDMYQCKCICKVIADNERALEVALGK